MRHRTFLAAFLLAATPAGAADLVISVHGLQDARGELRVAVFGEREAATFPDPERGMSSGVRIRAEALRPGEPVRVSLGPLAPGRYAVSVIHDANDNGALDKNWVGMPAEGFGFSRDATGSFGPPAFDDAAVVIGDDEDRLLRIDLRY